MIPDQICAVVNTALQQYEEGEKRSNLAAPPSDLSTIHKIRGFSDEKKGDLFKLAECFLQEPLVAGSGTEQVFFAILRECLPGINDSPIDMSMEIPEGLAAPLRDLSNQNNLQIVSRALCILMRKELFGAENFSKLIKHRRLMHLCAAIQMLSSSDILDQNSLAACLSYDFPWCLANELLCFPDLARLLLTSGNWAAVMAYREPYYMLLALSTLHKAELSTPENLAAVIARSYPNELAQALSTLHKAELSTPENWAAVTAHSRPNQLAEALSTLHQAKLSTSENLAAVMAHSYPQYLGEALFTLHQAGLLTSENRILFSIVIRDSDISDLGYPGGASLMLVTIKKLHRVNLLNQANLNHVCNSDHGYLHSEYFIYTVLPRIPLHLLTQETFDRLVAITTLYTTIERIGEEMHALVDRMLQPNRAADVFNGEQSTHTTSVHRSSSESASRLEHNHGEAVRRIGRDKILEEIHQHLSASTHKDASVALRCLHTLRNNGYSFIDPVSGVATTQLLSLLWMALHRSEESLLNDGIEQLITACYQIQREYSDNESSDDCPCCEAGEFNKFIESFVGLLPECELHYITREAASAKYRAELKIRGKTYVNQVMTNIKTDEAHSEAIALLKAIESNGFCAIADRIKDQISTVDYEVSSEYSEAFSANEAGKMAFQEMKNNTLECLMFDEDTSKQFRESLACSAGGRRHQKNQLAQARAAFFSSTPYRGDHREREEADTFRKRSTDEEKCSMATQRPVC
jgi:hypothetical protein